MLPTDRTLVERAARVYHTNKDASQALGITTRSFARLCRKFGIPTPYVRMRQAFAEASGRVLEE